MSNPQPNMSPTEISLPRPLFEGDDYEPDHPLIRALSEACTAHNLPAVKRLVETWQQNHSPPGPSNYPLGALEPPFYLAIRLDDAPIVSYLLEAGISLIQLAVVEALEHKCTSAMWQVFLNHGWDINAEIHHKRPPPLADILDNAELLTWFLEHGASPNATCRMGRTPFMVAAANAPLATVELLWSNGAEVGNALPCAARSKVPGRFEVIRFLLDNGAPIDAVEYEHNTYGFGSDFVIGSALNLAVCYGGDDTVELLLERGARIDIVDFDGRSALELARKFGSPKKVELLEKRLRLDRTKSGREITYWQADLINGPGGEKVELVPFAKGGDGVKGA